MRCEYKIKGAQTQNPNVTKHRLLVREGTHAKAAT